MKFYQGFYKPINPEKYKGDVNQIVHRSGLEKRFFLLLDKEDNITWWSSEEMFIPYVSPIDNRVHRYFVDIIFGTANGDTIMAEIKPSTQIKPPKPHGNKKNLINEQITYSINDAKWKAAEKFCQEKGFKFLILTEKNLPKVLKK